MKKRDIVIGGYAETAIDFKTGRSAYDLAGEALDLALAIATAALPTPGPPNPVTRLPEEEL